jgi:preprotein translocase subunit YajC
MLSALLAQDPGPAPGPAAGPRAGIDPMFLIAGLFLLFWLVVLLPMSRRQKKEQAQMMANLKRGSKVLTSAGIVGTVVTIKDGDDEIVIRSEDAKLRIKRSTVTVVLGSDEAEAAK